MLASKENATTPLVSIAMATYNGETFLKEQLDSIYAQAYRNIEVIVSDDCSTDATVEILKQYSTVYGLKYYANKTNLGFVKNFEKAVSLCSGVYIALADQDDIWETNKLEKLLDAIGDKLLIHSDCILIDTENNILKQHWKKDAGDEIAFENLLFRNVVTGCTTMFHRELLTLALPFPDGILYHDWWLALCAAKEKRIAYSSEGLVRYRQHKDQERGMTFKTLFFKRVLKNIIERIQKEEILRVKDSIRYQKQLKSLREDGRLVNGHSKIIDDVILYFKDYSKGILHLKMFLLGIRYRKYVYPTNNFLYIKNILWDIFG